MAKTGVVLHCLPEHCAIYFDWWVLGCSLSHLVFTFIHVTLKKIGNYGRLQYLRFCLFVNVVLTSDVCTAQ